MAPVAPKKRHGGSMPVAAPSAPAGCETWKKWSSQELTGLLRELFSAHSASHGPLKGSLDLDRFLVAQAALAKVQGLQENLLVATAAFNEVLALTSKASSAFEAFGAWQLQDFFKRGLQEGKVEDILRLGLQEVQQAVKQSDYEENLRNCRVKAIHADVARRKAFEQTAHQAIFKQETLERQRTDGERQRELRGNQIEEMKRQQMKEEQRRQEEQRMRREQRERDELREKQQEEQIRKKQQQVREADESQIKRKDGEERGQKKVRVDVFSQPLPPHFQLYCKSQQQKAIFSSLEKRARDTPLGGCHTASIPSLAEHLVKDTTSDVQRAWSIYAWICHQIAYDVDGFEGKAPRKSCRAEHVLQHGVCVCEGYARLFEALARAAGLQVTYVSGEARAGAAGSKSGKSAKDEGHAWNAVKLDGAWALIDCTWGAGSVTDQKFTPKFTTYFFGTPPDQLLYSHFAEKAPDGDAALLKHAISKEAFFSQPEVKAEFFAYGLSFPQGPRPVGLLTCRGSNTGWVQLNVPEDVELMLKLKDEGTELEQRCFLERRAKQEAIVHFRCPRGTKVYSLDIFAGSKHETSFIKICSFSVAADVGPTRSVEPYFPHVFSAFQEYGLEFTERLPRGMLVIDRSKGSARVKLPVLAANTTNLMIDLNGNHLTILERDDTGLTCSCDDCALQGEETLTVFAAKRGASRYAGVAKFKCRA